MLRRAGFILVAMWAISNVMYYFFPPHMQFYPAMDALAGIFFAILWARDRQGWQIVLTVLFGLQSAVHVWYFTLGATSYPIRVEYDAFLNALFLCEVATVAIAERIKRRRAR